MKGKCPMSNTGHHKPVKEFRYDGDKFYRHDRKPKIVEVRNRCRTCDQVQPLDGASKREVAYHPPVVPETF